MTDRSANRATTIWDRQRETVRAEVILKALLLFDEQGFDETTVDDIVAAVGISARSFFRYFATKEDLVLGDFVTPGLQVRDALAARPAGEDAWTALRAALQPAVDLTNADVPRSVLVLRVINSAASLRARKLEKHIAWSGMLVPLLVARLDPSGPDRQLAAGALVLGSISCLDVALARFVELDGEQPLDDLLDAAIAALRL